ncbi:MAG: Colicin production protein [Hyphomicrobiales bacterium]|nr:Colicin production protein [Hyphomicrobiales bacterium]
MPSYLDLGLIVVVLLSALLSMLRGFTREVLAIGSWAAAAAAAYYFHPLVLPFVKTYVQKDSVALAVAAGAVFFVTLIIVSILTVRLSDAILDSKVGALDRSLGFLFGAGRGLLLCVVAFVFFNWLVPDKSQPEWVKNARTKPLLQATGDQLMAMLPDDPESTFLNKFKKPKGDEPAPEDVTPSPAPSPAPGRRTDAAPSAPNRSTSPASRGL